ncbi:MAG: S26 family signal peptidase [Phycisphaerales bacterium]
MPSSPPPVGPQARTSAKETLTSIFIAFVMAFVFRGFVVEAFVIPTGSMAPTLMGAHVRGTDQETGTNWPVNYSQRPDNYGQLTGAPFPVQKRVGLEEPNTRERTTVAETPLLWGDRIFVMKYLVGVNTPRRWDCIVFKNPNDPPQSYIKRLIGLPGEQVALVDGDVFTRVPKPEDPRVSNPWAFSDWKCARKPEMAQRAMWQLVFDSQYSPLNPTRNSRRWFSPPWLGADESGSTAGWKMGDNGVYEFGGTGPTRLNWRTAERPIDDWYPYDVEIYQLGADIFPVSDVRMVVGVKPAAPGLKVSAVVRARGHNFRMEVDGTSVTVRMRPEQVDEVGSAEPWTTLAQGTLPAALTPGVVTNLEFWHADQSVQVWVDDQKVAEGAYDWTIGERLKHSVDLSLDDVAANPLSLVNPSQYRTPQVRWEFSGGAFTLHRAALWRDIFYQPSVYEMLAQGVKHPNFGAPGLTTHPAAPLQLSPKQFFVCGDNSPASLDARKWGPPHPWVAQVDPTLGVVPSDLVLGRAFFVYFPAPNRVFGLPVPDVGRMRWVW